MFWKQTASELCNYKEQLSAAQPVVLKEDHLFTWQTSKCHKVMGNKVIRVHV